MSDEQTEGGIEAVRREAIIETVKVGLEILGNQQLQNPDKIALTESILLRVEALADKQHHHPAILRKSPKQCYNEFDISVKLCNREYPPQSQQCKQCVSAAANTLQICLAGG